MDGFVTFGSLMALEHVNTQNTGAGDDSKSVLLIFCPTGETAGKVDVTPRMLELARMGFQFVGATRWDPQDMSYYLICAKEESLSEAVRDALLKDAPEIVWKAMNGFDHCTYSRNDSN